MNGDGFSAPGESGTAKSRAGRSGVAKWLHRLVASDEEILADQRQDAVARCGATPMDQCVDRQRVAISGTVTSVMVPAKDDDAQVEAELDDGSGQVILVWLGRRQINGIVAGVELQASGRLSERDGERVIYNPTYAIVSATS